MYLPSYCLSPPFNGVNFIVTPKYYFYCPLINIWVPPSTHYLKCWLFRLKIAGLDTPLIFTNKQTKCFYKCAAIPGLFFFSFSFVSVNKESMFDTTCWRRLDLNPGSSAFRSDRSTKCALPNVFIGHSRTLFVYFCCFKQFCSLKIVGFSGIQTLIGGVEGEHADHYLPRLYVCKPFLPSKEGNLPRCDTLQTINLKLHFQSFKANLYFNMFAYWFTMFDF